MDANLHTCTAGCGTPVSHPDHPCDPYWDSMLANLRRDLLLSLAGAETNSAVLAVAAFFCGNPPNFGPVRPACVSINRTSTGETTP